jgi:hypothetical protein
MQIRICIQQFTVQYDLCIFLQDLFKGNFGTVLYNFQIIGTNFGTKSFPKSKSLEEMQQNFNRKLFQIFLFLKILIWIQGRVSLKSLYSDPDLIFSVGIRNTDLQILIWLSVLCKCSLLILPSGDPLDLLATSEMSRSHKILLWTGTVCIQLRNK